jgi:hypothetical protein
MFFRMTNPGHEYYDYTSPFPAGLKKGIDPDTQLVYWDYYHTQASDYRKMIARHRELGKEPVVGSGIWTWTRLWYDHRTTMETALPCIDVCRQEKIAELFFTMWGDDGAECSHFSQLPALFYIAEYAKGNNDEEKIKAKFKSFVGIDFDEFMNIDCPNDVVPYLGRPKNPSKYMMYADYFNDFLDYTIQEGAGERYVAFARQLHATAKKSRRYGYVFDTAAKLCDVMAIKYELGLRTRRAYEAGDRETLEALAKNEYVKVERLIRIYGKAFEKQWFLDNKPHGFDVQDHRIGALLYRTDACRRRILDYVNGKIDRIEELEEALLPFKGERQSFSLNRAPFCATVNIVYHGSVPS